MKKPSFILAWASLMLLMVPQVACDGKVEAQNRPYIKPAPKEDDQSNNQKMPPKEDAPELTRQERLTEALEALTAEQTHRYLSRLAPMLVQRTLTMQENDRIQSDGGRAIRPLLTQWVKEPAFEQAARMMIQLKLSTSGQTDKVDFELPGHLAAYIVRNQLPLKTLLTADYCVNAEGEQTECDTGAPYNAGVLTTRAFMAGNASRFNLHRAATLLKAFACMGYPMAQNIEPSLQAEDLISMFQVTNEAEDTTGGFGNGFACYTCHSQFGAHAQLFVKYDKDGLWQMDATGEQDPEGELGRSYDGLFSSHMDNPQSARSEQSQMFGQPVDDLSKAAQVLANAPAFETCSVRNIMEYTFSLDETQTSTIAQQLLEEIVTQAKANQPDQAPTLQHLTIETFAHPSVAKVITDEEGAP